MAPRFSVIHKLRSALELISTVAVIVTATYFLLLMVRGSHREPPTLSKATYEKGQRLDLAPALSLQEGRSTTVLFLKTTCKYCTESMTFYQRLAAAADRGEVIVVGNEAEEALRKYVNDHGFHPDRIVSVAKEALAKIRGTPTLLVIDRTGVIREVHLGLLRSAAEEETLIQEIRRSS